MSYHGSVTCSHCYQRGHNRRSCPKYTELLERQYRSYLEAQGPEGLTTKVYADMLAKRTGIDPRTGKKLEKEKRMKKYTCSYCAIEGHTRRTCRFLKDDVKVYKYLTIQSRKRLLEEVKNYGAGLGSVINDTRGVWEGHDYVKHPDPQFVVALKWNVEGDLHPHNVSFFRTASLSRLGRLGSETYNGGPDRKVYNIARIEHLGPDALVRAGKCDFESLMPEGWLEAADWDYRKSIAFTSGDSRNYEFKYSDDGGPVGQARKALGLNPDPLA